MLQEAGHPSDPVDLSTTISSRDKCACPTILVQFLYHNASLSFSVERMANVSCLFFTTTGVIDRPIIFYKYDYYREKSFYGLLSELGTSKYYTGKKISKNKVKNTQLVTLLVIDSYIYKYKLLEVINYQLL